MSEIKTVAQPRNPFEGLSVNEAYDALIDRSRTDLPHWPDKKMQEGYTGFSGPGLFRRTAAFLDILVQDNAFVPNWKGLDYGCGWGRFASMFLSKGSPAQLDLVDAWAHTLRILDEGNFQNERWQVSDRLADSQIPPRNYDLIISFSVFTHLSAGVALHNMERLHRGLKSGGRLYFTLRHEEFFNHIAPDRAEAAREQVTKTGFWFEASNNLGSWPGADWGQAVVGPKFIAQLAEKYGPVRYLGKPHDFQHVHVITRQDEAGGSDRRL